MSARDSEPLERFSTLVSREDGEIDLARACLQIAEDVYPGLDVDGYLGEIERFAKRLRARLAPDAAVEDRVIALNEFLFGDLGFCGNADNYYDPRNSYLNEVHRPPHRHPAHAVGAVHGDRPAHRAAARGRVLSGAFPGAPADARRHPGARPVRGRRAAVRGRAARAPEARHSARGGRQPGGVPVAELPLDQFLEPASKRQILARLLRNLKGIYREKDSPERLLEVLNRMIIVAPEAAGERRDRGYVYQRLECWRPALQDLTEYLEREPDAADLHEVRASVMELSRRCARLARLRRGWN